MAGSSSKTTLARSRVGDAIILVLSAPGGAKEERGGDAVLQADLGVAPALDIRSVGALTHQRVAAHDDAVYPSGAGA